MRLALASTIAAAALTALAALPASAQTVLLHDSFDAENAGVGQGVYSGFAHFTASDVDLLAPGYFFHLCQAAGGSGACIDMEGNGNGSLTTSQAYTLAPGRVTLQFDLAGDQRNAMGNAVTASLIDSQGAAIFSESFALPWDAPFTTFTRSVDLTGAVSARLHFESSGRPDSYGLLLDNVMLTSVSAVPEPGSALLLAAGLTAVGRVARRRTTARV